MKSDRTIYVKRTVSIVLLLAFAFSFMIITQKRVDSSTLRIEGFYQEEEESLDVVMIGASDVHCGFSPGLAFGEYGFSSYLYTIDSNYLELYKYEIEEVLSRQTPKCFIIETTGALYECTENNNKERTATLHKFVDNIPLSKNKVEIINKFSADDKASFYFPFIVYHGDSNNFTGLYQRVSQKLRGKTLLKGIVSSNTVQEYEEIMNCNNDFTQLPISNQAEYNLLGFLNYCKDLNCKIIFTRFPHRITSQKERDELRKENYIEKIIIDNGFDFVNYDHLFSEVGLDTVKDFYSDSHLNIDGQKKLTNHLCKLLTSKYGIEKSELTNTAKVEWEKSYEYTELFYDYYDRHKNDKQDYWWYETPELLRDLDNLKTQLKK